MRQVYRDRSLCVVFVSIVGQIFLAIPFNPLNRTRVCGHFKLYYVICFRVTLLWTKEHYLGIGIMGPMVICLQLDCPQVK